MNSFNQTNPIANYEDIIKNLQDLGNNIQKIREKLVIILQQILQNPEIKKLILNNISLIKQYFVIQIQLNTILNQKLTYIPYVNKYYEYIINLNQNLLIKITTLAAVLETGDNLKIQQYINSLTNMELGGIYLSFGDRLKEITAHSLETMASKIRKFNTTDFLDQTKIGLDNIQNTLQNKISGLSSQLQNAINSSNLIEKSKENDDINTESIEVQKGGGNKFNSIFHPQVKKWVNIKSPHGIDALLKYAYYN
jgi:hypothetical protein